MNDETQIGARIALPVRIRGARRFAKSRRPGERKDIKIEISGRIRHTALRLRLLYPLRARCNAARPAEGGLRRSFGGKPRAGDRRKRGQSPQESCP